MQEWADEQVSGWKNRWMDGETRHLKLASCCFQPMSQCLLSPCCVPHLGVDLCCIRLESRRNANDLTFECA